MNGAEVGVVIACHSEKRFASIVAAAESVLAQDTPAKAVIITVDHNPPLAQRLITDVPGVQVVPNDAGTRGASATRNVGARAAQSELVAFLDDDEKAEPQWLRLLVEPLRDPSVVGTGGRYVPAWHGRSPVWFPDSFLWAVGAHHSRTPRTSTEVRNVWAGNMCVRRSDFLAAGGFRDDFGKVGTYSQQEDTELCIRLARHSGRRWVYVPQARIHHEVPSDRATFSFFLRRSYSEGHGKIFVADGLRAGEQSTLSDESDWIKRVVPTCAAADLRQFPAGWLRFAATLAGLAAAGCGAVAAKLRLARSGVSGRPGAGDTGRG